MDLRRLAFKVEFDGSTAAIKEMDGATNKLKNAAEKATKKLQSMGKSFNKVGKGLMKKITTPVIGLGTAAIKTVADFDDAMSKVQAMSGATGEEFEQLRELAKEYGATTRFSASEAAEGMTFLAMAGLEVNEIMATMPGLLDLAASSGMDLGRAADIATNILSGFGMEAREAGRVADVLAKGASSANTSVEQLGDAMKVVAPVASTLGLEIEGLTAAVGFMSDAGIQGSEAGRMLRQGMLRLAGPTGEAEKLIKQLGINVFDAEGNMKTLDEVVGELAKGLDGMSSQAQTAALATIFGAESVAGWTALLDRGAGELARYTSELQGSQGAAAAMAATMEDNIGGAFRTMKSQIEGFMITLGDVLKDDVRAVAQGIGDLASKFGELDEQTQQTIVQWGVIALAIGPVTLGISKIIGMASTAISVGTSLISGITTVAGLLKGPLVFGFKGALTAGKLLGAGLKGVVGILAGNIPLAIGLAVAAGILLYKNWDKIKKGAEKAWEGIVTTVEGAVSKIKGFWQGLKNFMKNPIKGIVNIFKRDKGGDSSVDGSHARGLARVPWDGYIAELHKGEEVLAADDPRNINNYKNITRTSNIQTTSSSPTIYYNPTFNIEVNGNATEQEITDLENRMRKVARESFQDFFYELSLQMP